MNRRNLLAVLAALPTALLAGVKAHTRRPLYVTDIDPVERSVTFDTEPYPRHYCGVCRLILSDTNWAFVLGPRGIEEIHSTCYDKWRAAL